MYVCILDVNVAKATQRRLKVKNIAMLATAMASLAAMGQAVRSIPYSGPDVPYGNSASFRHRDTKRHLSREDRDRKYKAQRAANRLRRKLGA